MHTTSGQPAYTDSSMKLYTLFSGVGCATSTPSRIVANAVLAVGRGDVIHCATGDGQTVLEQTLDGPRRLDFDRYVMAYPDLRYIVDVPMVPHDGWSPPSLRRPRIHRSVLCWMTRGRVRSDDCVAMVRSELAARCAVDVPRRVTTPAALLTHLIDRGCHAEEIA